MDGGNLGNNNLADWFPGPHPLPVCAEDHSLSIDIASMRQSTDVARAPKRPSETSVYVSLFH